MIDLNSLTWTDEYVDTMHGELYNLQRAEFVERGAHVELLIALDTDSRRASLGMQLGAGWFETENTQNWPAFDALFGRVEWQTWVDNWERDAAACLAREVADEDLM